VLSRSEITKYATPKPRGGCKAKTHLGKHEKSKDMGPLASMPGGPDETAMLAGDSGHSAVALAFRLTVLLHTKASSSDARAQCASSAVFTLRLRL
jgi:hypothetical protein